MSLVSAGSVNTRQTWETGALIWIDFSMDTFDITLFDAAETVTLILVPAALHLP